MKHTPGYWVVNPLRRDQICTADGETCIAVANREAGTADEVMANARLMAFAPELLEALELCLRACEADAHNVILAMEKGRRAIAKATGAAK